MAQLHAKEALVIIERHLRYEVNTLVVEGLPQAVGIESICGIVNIIPNMQVSPKVQQQQYARTPHGLKLPAALHPLRGICKVLKYRWRCSNYLVRFGPNVACLQIGFLFNYYGDDDGDRFNIHSLI